MRRSSDGDAISLTSDTDGLGPGSPLAFGVVDWTDTASSLAHVFVPTHSSIDHCYLHTECLHSGHRFRVNSVLLKVDNNQSMKFHALLVSFRPLNNLEKNFTFKSSKYLINIRILVYIPPGYLVGC